LVTLDEAFALKLCRHQGGVPMATIALDMQVLAGQVSGNQCL
jgi:hypothetical protein